MTAIRTISPPAIRIFGAAALPRTIHQDSRGFLMETMRHDDIAVRGSEFAMSYTSVTIPGEFRDKERWHVHRNQMDRFTVPMGEMILALFDARSDSPTRGQLEVIRVMGAPADFPNATPPASLQTSLVPIPPGVYHAIGNLSKHPFVLVNFPTHIYDPEDEGRVPFNEVPLPGRTAPFAWSDVSVSR